MKTKRLVTSAMLISLGIIISLVCEFIPFLNPPFGGTVTIAATLPIAVISYLYGVKWGVYSGFVFGFIKMLIGIKNVSALFMPGSDSYMGLIAGFFIIFLDYILAYTVIGFAGMFRGMKKTASLILGVSLMLFIRYIIHITSGAVFYGAWAEWFFTDTVMKDTAFASFVLSHFSGAGLGIIYSVIYNGCYMIPEIVITAAAVIPVSRIIPEKE